MAPSLSPNGALGRRSGDGLVLAFCSMLLLLGAPVNPMRQSPLGSIFSTRLRRHCRLRDRDKVRHSAGPAVLALKRQPGRFTSPRLWGKGEERPAPARSNPHRSHQREHRASEYLRLNLNGKVALLDDGGFYPWEWCMSQ